MREIVDRLMAFFSFWAVLFGFFMMHHHTDEQRGPGLLGSMICAAGLCYFWRVWWDSRK